MIDLSFQIESVEAPAYAAAPLLMFKLRISDAHADVPIHNVALCCQVRIEPTRRQYEPAEQELLGDLFGEPSRWGQTLRSMLWTHASVTVKPFMGSTVVDLPVPCTYDFNVATTKYFHAIEEGDVPLCFLFSGTIFFSGEGDGALQVAQIPWEKEVNYRLPIRAWKEMMELNYPNSAWLCLRKDVFERLYRFKVTSGLPTWEQALERLMEESSSDEPVVGRQNRAGRPV